MFFSYIPSIHKKTHSLHVVQICPIFLHFLVCKASKTFLCSSVRNGLHIVLDLIVENMFKELLQRACRSNFAILMTSDANHLYYLPAGVTRVLFSAFVLIVARDCWTI